MAKAQPPDAGTYTVVVSNELGVAMSQPARLSVIYASTTQPPILPRQTDAIIDELTLLTVTNTATDIEVPNLVLKYQLLEAPMGASIDGNGIISWRPGVAQAPSTNRITTVVSDNGFPVSWIWHPPAHR